MPSRSWNQDHRSYPRSHCFGVAETVAATGVAPIDPITGADLRRTREQQRVSLGKLAARIGRSKGHLSKVERDVDLRAVTPALVRDYQRALGVKVSATESSRAVDEDQDSPATVTRRPDLPNANTDLGFGDASAALSSESADSADADDDVQRRTLLSEAAISAFGLLVPEIGESKNPHIGLSDVRRLAEGTARKRRLDNYLGGADTYPTYILDLESTKKLHRVATFDDSTGDKLLALIAEQAQQAGWAAFDAGHHREAERLYLESLSAAQNAHDRSLAGNAYAYLGYQKVSIVRSGIEAASRSYETVGPDAPGAVRALMLERLALAHAVARQPNEAETALAEAHKALDEPGGGPAPDWAQWVDHDEIQIMTGRCWTELNRPLRAAPVLENVLRNFGDSHARDKSLYLTWLAAAYLDANEISQAAKVTSRAIILSAGVGSVRPQVRIRPLIRRLEPHRGIPEVDDLLALIRK
jgi:transcriptional regulator with XRE-family HTH domain